MAIMTRRTAEQTLKRVQGRLAGYQELTLDQWLWSAEDLRDVTMYCERAAAALSPGPALSRMEDDINERADAIARASRAARTEDGNG